MKSVPSLLLLSGPHSLRVVVQVMIPSVGEIGLLKNRIVCQNKKRTSIKKQLHKKCKYEDTMNAIS